MTWTRHGECNNCGHCCQTFKRDIVVRDPATVADPAFYEARGFTPVMVDGQERLMLTGWMQAPCPAHAGGGCLIYHDRPQTCQSFPTAPADVVDSPCSYWFDNGTAKAGGMGSPHPTTITGLMAIEAQEATHGLHD
jgi:Fe-S-cluster containining protein